MAPKENQQQRNTYNALFNTKKSKDKHGIVIAGHRGGRNTRQPENTMRAFEEAVEIGL